MTDRPLDQSKSFETVPRHPVARSLAQGKDWRVHDVTCRLGPQDRGFEEQHGDVAIAIVLEGSFLYRSDSGRSLMYPGSLLLGNAGACFECGHEHGTGDHCIAFGFEPALFEEIAASCGGTSKYRFKAARLPSSPSMTAALAAAAALRAGAQAAEELAIGLAERVIRATSAFIPGAASPSARDLRRISDALRFVDEHYDEPLDLERLAAIAHMSRYHFLRTFRKVVASTPHRYLLNVRLRRAAERLRGSDESVASIASQAGFGDLSTFYQHFRRAFGHPPH